MAEKKQTMKKNANAADKQLAERSGESKPGAGEFPSSSNGGGELNSLSKGGGSELNSLGKGGGSELTALSHASEDTTVALSATAAVTEGGTITYTASVGSNPVLSPVTVVLNNGQTISILPGQTSASVTVAVPADVYGSTPGAPVAAISSVTGNGGFEQLAFNPAVVRTAVSDVVNTTTVSL